MTHGAMVLVEGVILIQEDVLVFGRRVCEMDGVSPWPHTSSAAEAHS